MSAGDQGNADGEAAAWTAPFTSAARYYDALYTRERDYPAQAARVAATARELYIEAFQQAGFQVRHDPQGLDPARGLYAGNLAGSGPAGS